MGVWVGVGVFVGDDVAEGVSVGAGVNVAVPCGDNMAGMFVDVGAGSGADEAGVVSVPQAESTNVKMMRYKIFFIA